MTQLIEKNLSFKEAKSLLRKAKAAYNEPNKPIVIDYLLNQLKNEVKALGYHEFTKICEQYRGTATERTVNEGILLRLRYDYDIKD